MSKCSKVFRSCVESMASTQKPGEIPRDIWLATMIQKKGSAEPFLRSRGQQGCPAVSNTLDTYIKASEHHSWIQACSCSAFVKVSPKAPGAWVSII